MHWHQGQANSVSVLPPVTHVQLLGMLGATMENGKMVGLGCPAREQTAVWMTGIVSVPILSISGNVEHERDA